MFEYHVVRGDFIAPRGGGHRDRRRDLRIPSPMEPLNHSNFCDKRLKYKGFYCKNNLKSEVSYLSDTSQPLPGGSAAAGLIRLPRVYRDIGIWCPVLSLVATSEFGAAGCVRACIACVSVGFVGLVSLVFHWWGRGRLNSATWGFAECFCRVCGRFVLSIGTGVMRKMGFCGFYMGAISGVMGPL